MADQTDMEVTQEVDTSAVNEEQPKKVDNDPKLLDLAFAMDCTGSMGSYIYSAQQNIRKIVEDIVAAEQANVRLALVEYRDHPPQDRSFVTNVHDFTGSVSEMRGWLDKCKADGGGDQAEAVADALHQVLKLSWRENSTKVCVFIADAPPHGLGLEGDGFPNGCPDGLDCMTTTNKLAEKCIAIYMVGCEPSITPFRDFFMGLAHLTGGQYVPLASAQLLSRVITGGVQEQISLQQLMEEVNTEVIQEFQAAGADCDIEEADLTRKVHEKFKVRGVQAKKLHRNKAELPEHSVQAQQMSSAPNMAQAREMFMASIPEPARMEFGAPRMASGGALRSAARKSKAPARKSKASASRAATDHLEPALFDESENLDAPGLDLASATDCYETVEDDISEQQVQRMVQQSVWSNQLKTRFKKKH